MKIIKDWYRYDHLPGYMNLLSEISSNEEGDEKEELRLCKDHPRGNIYLIRSLYIEEGNQEYIETHFQSIETFNKVNEHILKGAEILNKMTLNALSI